MNDDLEALSIQLVDTNDRLPNIRSIFDATGHPVRRIAEALERACLEPNRPLPHCPFGPSFEPGQAPHFVQGNASSNQLGERSGARSDSPCLSGFIAPCQIGEVESDRRFKFPAWFVRNRRNRSRDDLPESFAPASALGRAEEGCGS